MVDWQILDYGPLGVGKKTIVSMGKKFIQESPTM